MLGAVAFAPLLRVPTARAAGVFADEATYLFDPASRLFEPDPAIWLRRGDLTPIAVPDRGLGAAGVGSTLSYTHFPPPLARGEHARLRAQLFNAISTRLTLDDGSVRVIVAPAIDPVTFQAVLRVLDTDAVLPFPWDNGYANIVDVEMRPDGQVAITATNLDPAGDGTSQTVFFSERPPSSGRPAVAFGWDRSGSQQSDSSCWVRVGTQWGGVGSGVILPEVGDEVVVAFLEGDPDRPIVVGTVYNNRTTFPEPVDPQQDVWTIRTTSGRGFLNEFSSVPGEVRFDRGRQLFLWKSRDDAAAKVEMRFVPLDPPFVWGFELEARRSPSLFPLALARSRDGALASVLNVELQVGDLTGSKTYRLCGSDGRLSSC